MSGTSVAPPARFSSHSPRERNEKRDRYGVEKQMSDNDKWVWSTDEDPIPALFRPEPSTSRKEGGLHLDLIPPETPKTPAASASLCKGVALHLEGKSDAALQELSAAIPGGENLAELHS